MARAVAHCALGESFVQEEAAELFLVGVHLATCAGAEPAGCSLPYCAKPVECDYRQLADCGRCGRCQLSLFYDLAEELGLTPTPIESF
ncbi:hypothetical protein DFAR_1990003 [Desulfarculales bacterium]